MCFEKLRVREIGSGFHCITVKRLFKGQCHENHFKNLREQKHINSNGNLQEVAHFRKNNNPSVMKLTKK